MKLDSPHPVHIEPRRVRVDHGTSDRFPATQSRQRPTETVNHVNAWNRPSQTMLYFISTRSIGGRTLESMLCHWRI